MPEACAPHETLTQTPLLRVFAAASCQTQAELATFLGVRQSAISYAKKRSSIPAEWFITLLRKKSINPEWIMTGQGPQTLYSYQNNEATPGGMLHFEDVDKVLRLIVEQAPIPACIIDTVNYNILFKNKHCDNIIKDYWSTCSKCFELLYGNDAPCSSCPVIEYRKRRSKVSEVVERYNKKNSMWLKTYFIMIDVASRDPMSLVFFEECAQPSIYTQQDIPSRIDQLTGLLSYSGFKHESAELFTKSQENGHAIAVIALKIDGLQQINSLYSHKDGDEILIRLSRSILALIPNKAILGRLRRNEFCILLPMETPLTNQSIGELSKELCTLPTRLASDIVKASLCRIFVGASIQDQNESLDDLKFLAWDACSRAMVAREHLYEVIESHNVSQRLAIKQLESELLQAVRGNEMELYFQPKYDTRDSTMVGAEALIRWNHSTRGQILPGLFIPMAERNGHIGIIDTWVIKQCCYLLCRIIKQGYRPIPFSFNLSPRTFFDIRLEELLLKECERYEIPPSLLEIEVTESMAFYNLPLAQEIMLRLQRSGFRLHMDDFGVGHSSLGNLNVLPFNAIKIDRSFLANICPKTHKTFPFIVSLVKSHDMDVIVEGVETQEQLHITQDAGCHIIQGYYFSKPLPLNIFIEALLQQSLSLSQC